jgi:hypothetical protein
MFLERKYQKYKLYTKSTANYAGIVNSYHKQAIWYRKATSMPSVNEKWKQQA